MTARSRNQAEVARKHLVVASGSVCSESVYLTRSDIWHNQYCHTFIYNYIPSECAPLIKISVACLCETSNEPRPQYLGGLCFTCDSEDGLPLITSPPVLSGTVIFSSIVLLHIGKVQSSILCTGPWWQQLVSHTEVDCVQCHWVISLLQPKHCATYRASYFDSPPMYLSPGGPIVDCACASPRLQV